MEPNQRVEALKGNLVNISTEINDILRTSGRHLSAEKRQILEELSRTVNVAISGLQ